MSDNPLKTPVPETVLGKVEKFVYDLAWGVIEGKWGNNFHVSSGIGRVDEWSSWDSLNDEFRLYMENIWDKLPPSKDLLLSFGYIIVLERQQYSTIYILSEKAFDLLKAPAIAPTIFISYGHRFSSALALLIEARLRNVDKQIGVFIDKSIPLGKEWHAHLKDEVSRCEYFIVLLGQSLELENGKEKTVFTLNSDYVRQEIEWAFEANSVIIPICHSGYSLTSETDTLNGELWDKLHELQKKQAIFVGAESADEYEFAVSKLLNRLGYPTYTTY